MKWIFLGIFLIAALPFIVKIIYMLYALYRHYFYTAINSKFPVHVSILSFIGIGGSREDRQERKPIGFDTSFTEEDKQRLESARQKLEPKSKKR